MKKSISKKIVTGLLSVMLLASGTMLMVSAGNTADTWFDFNFSSVDKWDTTGERSKQDSTSVYMSCVHTDYSYVGHVYSAGASGNHYDTSGGYSYTFTTGTVRYMTNYSYERGYRNAGIDVVSSGFANTTSNGWWSPDSV